MKKLVFILFSFILFSSAYAGTVYKWVDREGVVNFTEDYDKVPAIYRNRVEKIDVETGDIQKMEGPAASKAPLEKKEGASTDIYGRDEIWWREKVRPWKEQLKQATVNYETADKRYSERLQELSGKEQLSRTQHKMSITELHSLKEEKMKYKAQIDEANEMIEKLSKEASEAKANPDWLK